jgi:hypothetical protein
MDEMVGGWRKLLNKELHNLYSSPDIITSRMIRSRRMRWSGRVAFMGRIGLHIGKRPLRIPRRRW